jgi:hypothetical protein
VSNKHGHLRLHNFFSLPPIRLWNEANQSGRCAVIAADPTTEIASHDELHHQ